MNAKVLELIDEQPGDECTPFPIETLLSVMEAVVGQKRGTAISGVGRCLQRSPKKRGGGRSSAADIILEEQVKKAQEDAQRAREESQAQSERIRRLEETIASLIANQHVTGTKRLAKKESTWIWAIFPNVSMEMMVQMQLGMIFRLLRMMMHVEANDVEAADVDEVEGTDDDASH